MLGVCSSGAASGSVYCNGVVVEQPTLGRYIHLVGNENVLQVGILLEHTLAQGGDGVRHLEAEVFFCGGIDQKLSHIAVKEHAILRGEGGIAFGHLELLQVGVTGKCFDSLVNILQSSREGDACKSVGIGPITYIDIQRSGGNVPELVGNVQRGIVTQIVADSHAIEVGENVVSLFFLDAVTIIRLMTLAKLCYIGAHYIPAVGGVHKDPSFIFCIGHVPGVAAAGGIAVDQDTGDAQIGEHGLGQVGIGLADSFFLRKGSVGVLICNIGRIRDVPVDKVLNSDHFLEVISNAVGDLPGFCTDLLKLRLSDDDVIVGHIGLRVGLLQHIHQLLVGAQGVHGW